VQGCKQWLLHWEQWGTSWWLWSSNRNEDGKIHGEWGRKVHVKEKRGHEGELKPN